MEQWEESLALLLFKLYELKCKRIRRLNGYDDLNFHVMVQDKESSYTIKILSTSNSNDPEFINEYIRVLLHLQKENIICPHPVMNAELKYQSFATDWEGEMKGIFKEMNKRIIMLHEYHDAELLLNVKLTEKLCYELGVYISELHRKMMEFNDSCILRNKSITGVWSLENMPHVSKYLHLIQNDEDREIAGKIIEEFKQRVISSIPNLQSGVLHGDVNDQNILVKRKGIDGEWSIYGIIDFSDMINSCYLFELAVSVAYLWLRDPSNKQNGVIFLAPYRSLTFLEYDLFKICVCGRLVQSLVLGLKAYNDNPENKYVLDTQSGWPLLRQLYNENEKQFVDWLKYNVQLYKERIN